MNETLTAKDILNDIEFELLQGVIAQGKLSDAVRAVKQFQNTARAETFRSLNTNAIHRDLVSRQFQINDMLIALLEETALTLQLVQQPQRARGDVMPQDQAIVEPRAAVVPRVPLTETRLTRDPLVSRPPAEIENAMRSEAIQVELQMNAIGIPLLSGVLMWFRALWHRAALFYVHLFANRQAPINRTYGEWLLDHAQRLQQQQDQIDALNTQVLALRARLEQS